MGLTSDEKDGNCDGVKKVVSGLKICVDAKMVSRVIDVEDEGTEVGSPSPCNCGTADDILQDDVACPNERPEITKLHSQVRERPACTFKQGVSVIFYRHRRLAHLTRMESGKQTL